MDVQVKEDVKLLLQPPPSLKEHLPPQPAAPAMLMMQVSKLHTTCLMVSLL